MTILKLLRNISFITLFVYHYLLFVDHVFSCQNDFSNLTSKTKKRSLLLPALKRIVCFCGSVLLVATAFTQGKVLVSYAFVDDSYYQFIAPTKTIIMKQILIALAVIMMTLPCC